MKIKSIIAAGFFACSFLFSAETVSLDKLIRLSFEHSPEIDISRLNTAAALERINQAEGERLPLVNASGGLHSIMNKNEIDTHSVFGTVGGTTDGRLATAVLSASQLVYDFGRTDGRVDARSQEYAAFEKEMKIIIQKKVFSVKKYYFEVLKSDSNIRIQKENVKISKEQLERAKRYFTAGLKTKVDISNAQVLLLDAKQSLKRAQYNKKLSMAKLIEAVGYVPQKGEYRLSAKKVPMPTPSKNLPRKKATLKNLEDYALLHRYELQQQDNLINSAGALLQSQEANYYPTFTLDAQALAQSLHTDEPTMEAFYPERSFQLGLNLRWNLFEGFKTDSRVEEAKINKLKALSSKEIIKLQIRRQVSDAYFLLRQANDIMELAEGLVKASHLKFNQTKRRYKSDLADYIELQDAQKDYVNAKTSLANAYYDYYIALALVDLAIGKEYI